MVECDEQNIVARVLEMQNRESTSGKAAAQRELKAHTSCLPMLDKLIEKFSEGMDTENGERDIIPFFNAMNDYYLKNLSDRIRSVMAAKARDGQKNLW